ncbi:MAG: hypothetical protein WBZ36_21445 [Candidatus Nitrosopolaris sp.]
MSSNVRCSKTEYLTFNTNTTRAFVNITQDVRRQNQRRPMFSKCHYSIFINDNESGLHEDFDIWLEKIAPLLLLSNTVTTKQTKIMLMPTLSARLWEEKL